VNDIYRSAQGARAVREWYREQLASWPVPSEEHRLPTSQGETFVLASGPAGAPPLVLLHGSGANSAVWRADVAVWAGRFRVYAVDLIGEPGRSAPSRPPLGSDAHAAWLDDVLEALGMKHAPFVGESIGGWLAVDYATRRPGRVDRLALLCPSGIGRSKVGVLIAAGLLLPLGRWGRRTAMRLAIGSALPPAVIEQILLVYRHFRPRRERLPVFGDDTLRLLTMPVLVTAGGRDRMIDSAGTRRRLAATVPHAMVTVLPGAGHLLPRQTGAILDFLVSEERSHA
jgi:pimeloyl-ACP methyl ester carboxylesterase